MVVTVSYVVRELRPNASPAPEATCELMDTSSPTGVRGAATDADAGGFI